MSEKKAVKEIDGVDYEVVDMVDAAPVELDGPDPALARWQALADRATYIEHGGDATKVLPIPRPAWSEPDADVVSDAISRSYYSSDTAFVAATNSEGKLVGDSWELSGVMVAAEQYGNGDRLVSMAARRVAASTGKWHSWKVFLTVAEALELIDVLHAAVDLFGGAK